MLNKAPIFVNGFHRGGTNIAINLVASHPDVCTLRGETHEIFYGKNREPIRKWVHRLFYLPILTASRQHFFWPYCLGERNQMPRLLMYYVDMLFYCNRLAASTNRFKTEGTKYPEWRRGDCRLLAKNANGLVFATDLFAEMYPDAAFIALVRNGLALCEGYIRRGFTAEDFGMMYEKVCQRMIHDVGGVDNYYVVRFEDMISDPATFIKEVYKYLGLDVSTVTRFRLQAKKSTAKDGTRQYTFGGADRETHWFALDELGHYLRKDVNENQIARLSVQDKRTFLQQAQTSMEYFGYL